MGITDHWLSPPQIADGLARMGGVGLDPASNPWSLIEAEHRVFLPRDWDPFELRDQIAGYGPWSELTEKQQAELGFLRVQERCAREVVQPFARRPDVDGTFPSSWVYADGLSLRWDGHGLVYFNCPYSGPSPWHKKASEEGDEVVSLLPATVSEGYWHEYIFPTMSATLFFKGRLSYWEYDAVEGVVRKGRYPARFASALTYWGERVDLFAEAFGALGKIITAEALR